MKLVARYVYMLYTKRTHVKKIICMINPMPQNYAHMAAPIYIMVDGCKVACKQGQTVASALLMQKVYLFRFSPSARTPRGPFCMMGACQECAIQIDGSIRRACQVEVQDGMRVEFLGAGAQ
jgi:predicted molibdopterin-dependent oxidoreductase YjgC